jgi:hypothetical protein
MISIIIPTCKSVNFLPCRDSVLKNTNRDDVEIIVVANGYDGSRDDFNGLKLIWFDQRIGYTKAVNHGIRESKGDFVILLNDDTVVLDWGMNAWIDTLMKPFSDPKVGITGPVKDFCGNSQRNFMIFFCVCIRRALFDELGLLDEVFNPGGGEDTDFCIKTENAGYSLVQVPNEHKELKGGQWVTSFPLYHAAEKTVFDLPEWSDIINRNRQTLKERYATLPEGAFWPDDIKEYRRLLEMVPDGGTYAELGTAYGRSMCSVADIIRRKKLKVVAVDTFQGTECEKTPEQKLQVIDYKKDFEANIKRFGLEPYVSVHQGMTNQVVSNFFDDTFDLIFIDADHSYEAVRQDIDQWRPKLKKTGIMAGHDYGGTWTGVKKAADETFPIVLTGGLVWSTSKKHHVSVSLCTRGRYTTTLPMAMASLITQTRRPDFVYLYDDTPEPEWTDLREIPVLKSILATYDKLGIGWYIIYGYKKGQHFGDQEVNRRSKDLVFRFDDDCVADANVIEELEKALTDDVGAVGCSVINPLMQFSGNATGKLANIKAEPNMQWVGGQGEVEHLHSCFLYRAHVADFDLTLSPRSFRGETMFSHEIMMKGYKLKVINTTTIWHYQNSSGGCRANVQDGAEAYAHDEHIFNNWMRMKVMKFFYLDNGLGDHIVFRKLLDDLKIARATVACCYPEVFQGTGLNIISLAEAQKMGCNPEQHNLYKWMDMNGWKRPLYEAFKEMYRL